MVNTIALEVALGQFNLIAGNPRKNTDKILEFIENARTQKADIIVFPEMAVPGYLLSDNWEDDAFVIDCWKFNEEIRLASKDITVIFGNVLPDPRPSLFNPDRPSFGNDGRLRKYNSAVVASNGEYAKQIQNIPLFNNQKLYPQEGVTIKTNEPLYREFEDQRHFLPLKELAQQTNIPLEKLLQPFQINIKNIILNIGVIVCEDIWTGDYVYNGKILNPGEIMIDNGAELLIAISTSPFGWRKNKARQKHMYKIQKDLYEKNKATPLVYFNALGYQNNGKNEFGLDGRSVVLNKDGQCLLEVPAWQEGVFEVELPLFEKTGDFSPPPAEITKQEEREELHGALVTGIKEFVKQKGVEKIIIGLSGGIDSSLIAALCVEAVGKEKILGVNMPTKFNSEWTKSVANEVANNLGIAYQVVPIEDVANIVRSKIEGVNFNGDYGKYSPEHKDRVVDENLQARIRSADILAGIAAKYDRAIYTSNGNKTEILLGWFTIDGDGGGAICPLGDVFKTQIADLATDMNLNFIKTNNGKVLFPWELITPLFDPGRYYDQWDKQTLPFPKDTKTLVPSAELSKNQDVNKQLGDPIIFEYHDPLLRQFIEYRKNPEDILKAFLENGFPGLAATLNIPETLLSKIINKNFPAPGNWVNDLERIWKQYHLAVFKQIQSPPVITVSKRSLGYDFRRSQLPPYYTQKYLEYRKTVLESDSWMV